MKRNEDPSTIFGRTQQLLSSTRGARLRLKSKLTLKLNEQQTEWKTEKLRDREANWENFCKTWSWRGFDSQSRIVSHSVIGCGVLRVPFSVWRPPKNARLFRCCCCTVGPSSEDFDKRRVCVRAQFGNFSLRFSHCYRRMFILTSMLIICIQ